MKKIRMKCYLVFFTACLMLSSCASMPGDIDQEEGSNETRIKIQKILVVNYKDYKSVPMVYADLVTNQDSSKIIYTFVPDDSENLEGIGTVKLRPVRIIATVSYQGDKFVILGKDFPLTEYAVLEKRGDMFNEARFKYVIVNLKPLTAYDFLYYAVRKYEMANYEDARLSFEKALQMDPNIIEAVVYKGLSCWKLKKYSNALDDLDNAIKTTRDPSLLSIAYLGRGNVFLEKGNFEDAISDFDQVLELDPKQPRIIELKANAYFSLGDFDAAINFFTKAIELDPENVNLYEERGNAYFKDENYEKAVADFSKAIETNPKEVNYYYFRGNTYTAMDEMESAINDFEKIVELYPVDAGAYKNLGDVYLKSGNKEQAIAKYKKSADLGNDMVLSVLKKLKVDYKPKK